MKDEHLKPLDIVATPRDSVAMVTDVHEDGDCSIVFIYRNPSHYDPSDKREGDKMAWWEHGQLRLLNSLPNLLSKAVKHPFGTSVNPYNIDDR